jgi:hypothetical protein
LDGGVFEKFRWELRCGWREVFQGKVALLADHHVATYLEIFRRGGGVVEEGTGLREEGLLSTGPLLHRSVEERE